MVRWYFLVHLPLGLMSAALTLSAAMMGFEAASLAWAPARPWRRQALLPAMCDVVSDVPSDMADDEQPVGVNPDSGAQISRLLEVARETDRGFSSSPEQRSEIQKLLKELTKDNPLIMGKTALDGDWELLWTDAPDILGLRGGPIARLRRIGQQIDTRAGTIENVIEYEPARWNPLVSQLGAQDDRLQQRVLLSCEYSGNRCNLRLAGPLDIPFGSFDVLYNDGSVRVVKTQQGFYSLNQKMEPGYGWDESP